MKLFVILKQENQLTPMSLGIWGINLFRKHRASAQERGIDRKQFLDEHNDSSHYRPELPSSNRSHSCEDMTDQYLGP